MKTRRELYGAESDLRRIKSGMITTKYFPLGIRASLLCNLFLWDMSLYEQYRPDTDPWHCVTLPRSKQFSGEALQAAMKSSSCIPYAVLLVWFPTHT